MIHQMIWSFGNLSAKTVVFVGCGKLRAMFFLKVLVRFIASVGISFASLSHNVICPKHTVLSRFADQRATQMRNRRVFAFANHHTFRKRLEQSSKSTFVCHFFEIF